jgi:hypothetical protein
VYLPGPAFQRRPLLETSYDSVTGKVHPPSLAPFPADPQVSSIAPALRYFALDGTDHASHKEQASMIRRYIIWRNNHAYDERLRRIVDKANVA